MTVRWETAQVDGNPMRIYLGVPDRPGTYPGIVVAQHRGGVDEVIQDVVHRLRRQGYVAAAPEFFHRLPRDIEESKRTASLRDNEIIADIEATIGVLKKLPTFAGPLGVVGFCMGGRVSYLAAAAISEVKAAAMFYGGNIMKLRGEGPTPFERSANIQCPLIGFFGAEDDNPSPDDMKRMDAELTGLGKWHEFHSYLETGHGFLNFLNKDRYRERAARAAWHEMLAFFSERLKPISKN